MRTKKKKWLGIIAGLLVLVIVAAALPRIWYEVRFALSDHAAVVRVVKAYAQEHGVSYLEYPKSLLELMERNPETEEFVLNYPFRADVDVDMSEFDRTEGVPLMMQWDTRWGYMEYGSNLVGITGCGPVCLAMAGYYVTGDEKFAPDKMVEFSLDNGYSVYGKGTAWTLISEGAVELGLDVTEIPLVKQRILDNLEAGNPIICAMGPGDFTSSGHFIVLVGTEDGMIRVNDPNSRANSEKLWTYEQMESQFRNLWVIRDGA